MEIDFILTNLKIISLVQINEKLSIIHGHLQIDYNPLQFLKRWFNRDSRKTIIIFLNDLLKKINLLFDKFEDKNSISIILNEMDKILNGLNNLKITYSDDCLTNVKIDTLIIHFKSLSVYGRTLI